jgi:hypothetical protein
VHHLDDDFSAVDHDVFYTPELLGHECDACRRVLAYKFYEKDSSYTSGYKPVCISCQQEPRLSMEEHLFRLKAKNFNSEAVKRQRHEDQEEWRLYEARRGRTMHASEFILKLHKLVPSLFIKEGGIYNHLAMYLVADQPQKKWDGKNFKYFGWVEYTTLPEYDIWSFDEAIDVCIRVEEGGWRNILLRFIREGLITEEQCDKTFGKPTGRGANTWHKKIWNHKNLERVQKMDNSMPTH